MENNVIPAIAVPMGVLVAIVVQLMKIIPMPEWAVQLTVLLFALALTVTFNYSTNLFEILAGLIHTAGVAMLTYELFIKKIIK